MLTNNVQPSDLIYQLSAIIPLKCVIKDLHRIFARFLCNFKEEGRIKHWVSREEMCLPKKERG